MLTCARGIDDVQRIRKLLKAFYKPVLRGSTFGFGILLCAHSQSHTVHTAGGVGAAAVQYAVGSVLFALTLPQFPGNKAEKCVVVSNGIAWMHGFYTLATVVAAAAAAAAAAEPLDGDSAAAGYGLIASVTDAQVATLFARVSGFLTLLGLDTAFDGNLRVYSFLKSVGTVVAKLVEAAFRAGRSVCTTVTRGLGNVDDAVSAVSKSGFTKSVTVVRLIIDGIAGVARAIYKGEAKLESFVINVAIIPSAQAIFNTLTWIKDHIALPIVRFAWNTLKAAWRCACTGYRFARDSVVIPAWKLACRIVRGVYNGVVVALEFGRDNVVVPAWNLACRIARAAWDLTCRAARAVWNGACHACRVARDKLVVPVLNAIWNAICRAATFVRDYIVNPGKRFIVRTAQLGWNEVIVPAARWTRDRVIVPGAKWTVSAVKTAFRIITSNTSFASFIGFCALSFANAAVRMVTDGGVDVTFATASGAAHFCMLSYAAWSLSPLALCLAGRALRDLNVHNPVFNVSERVDNVGFKLEMFATTWFAHLDLGMINLVHKVGRKAANTTLTIVETLLSLLRDGVEAVFKAALNIVEACAPIYCFVSFPPRICSNTADGADGVVLPTPPDPRQCSLGAAAPCYGTF